MEPLRINAFIRYVTHYAGLLAYVDSLYLEGGDSVLAATALFDLERRNIEAARAWSESQAPMNAEAASLCSSFANAGSFICTFKLHPLERRRWLESAGAAAPAPANHQKAAGAFGRLG